MWLFVALLAVQAAVCLVVARRQRKPPARRLRGNSFAVRHKLFVAPADVERVDATLDRRTAARWSSAAACFAVAALGVALVAGVRDHAGDFFGPTLYLGIIAVGWIGGLLGEVAPRFRAQSGTRAARLRPLRVSDFLHPALRGYLALVALAGLLLAAAPGARPPLLAEISLVEGLFPTVVLVSCELFAKLLVTLPHPAADQGELYLADSLRADALWSCYQQGAVMAPLLLLVLLGLAGETKADTAAHVALVVVVLVVPSLVAHRPRWSHLRFRERLWPDLPADAVVSTATGAPVA